MVGVNNHQLCLWLDGPDHDIVMLSQMARHKLKGEKLREELLSGKLPEGSVKVCVHTWVTMICGTCAPKGFFFFSRDSGLPEQIAITSISLFLVSGVHS